MPNCPEHMVGQMMEGVMIACLRLTDAEGRKMPLHIRPEQARRFAVLILDEILPDFFDTSST